MLGNETQHTDNKRDRSITDSRQGISPILEIQNLSLEIFFLNFL